MNIEDALRHFGVLMRADGLHESGRSSAEIDGGSNGTSTLLMLPFRGIARVAERRGGQAEGLDNP